MADSLWFHVRFDQTKKGYENSCFFSIFLFFSIPSFSPFRWYMIHVYHLKVCLLSHPKHINKQFSPPSLSVFLHLFLLPLSRSLSHTYRYIVTYTLCISPLPNLFQANTNLSIWNERFTSFWSKGKSTTKRVWWAHYYQKSNLLLTRFLKYT